MRADGKIRGAIRITDHGLLRWLERSGALDVEAVRTALAGSLARAVAAAAKLEASQFTIVADGMIYLVRDGALVTIYEDGGRQDHVRANAIRPRD